MNEREYEIDLHEGGVFLPDGDWRMTECRGTGDRWTIHGTHVVYHVIPAGYTQIDDERGELAGVELAVTVPSGGHPDHSEWIEYQIE